MDYILILPEIKIFKIKHEFFAFFLGSPTQWFLKDWSESEIKLFKQSVINNSLLEFKNIIVHASYLINGSSDKLIVKQKSYTRLLNELLLAEKLNV